MTGDHLSARQRTGAWKGQHSLSSLSGLAYASPGLNPAASRIQLPRCGKVGVPLIDTQVRVATSGYNGLNGVTLEAVYLTTVTGFNFFGSPWGRTVVRWYGYYGFNVNIEMVPIWGSVVDTQGRASLGIGDAGGTWITSRTVHERPPINDGRPHHLALVFDPSPARTARMYVDGVLVESVTTGGTHSDFAANEFYGSVEAFFTHCDGDLSHMCATGAALSHKEIIARARLTPSLSGGHPQTAGLGPLPDSGQVMGWDEANAQWAQVKDATGRLVKV